MSEFTESTRAGAAFAFPVAGGGDLCCLQFGDKVASGEQGKIVVTQGQLLSMREGYIRTWQRQPTTKKWKA